MTDADRMTDETCSWGDLNDELRGMAEVIDLSDREFDIDNITEFMSKPVPPISRMEIWMEHLTDEEVVGAILAHLRVNKGFKFSIVSSEERYKRFRAYFEAHPEAKAKLERYENGDYE